jgi:CarD family transcriptional regulator
MFTVGDNLLYGTVGVCTVKEMRREKIGGQWDDYVVLEPVFQRNATVLVPMSNEKLAGKMQPLLTEPEMTALLATLPAVDDTWSLSENERQAAFREAVRSGDRSRWLWLIKTIHRRQQVLLAAGRHLRSFDAIVYKETLALLGGEIAFLRGMTIEAAQEQLQELLK